jgi:hypothetical protein
MGSMRTVRSPLLTAPPLNAGTISVKRMLTFCYNFCFVRQVLCGNHAYTRVRAQFTFEEVTNSLTLIIYFFLIFVNNVYIYQEKCFLV